MKKKRSTKKIILLILLAVVVLFGSAVGGSYLYFRSKLSKINNTKISKKPSDLGFNPSDFNSSSKSEDSFVNILLFGVDSRIKSSDDARSDSIMILTLDKKHNKLKISSIMRDSYVSIEGHGEDKINAAYAYGGPQLAIKTVNQNYKMDIKDFIKVDFFGLEKIIDYVGGVSINISDAERKVANQYISEVSKIENKSPDYITTSGEQTLSGIQAVAYARIRYVGNSDFQRTERQRTVLTQLFSKLQSKGISGLSGAADNILPYVETSMSNGDLTGLSTYVITHNIKTVEQMRVPIDGLYKDAVIRGMDVLTWDKEPTIKKLHQFIFETND